MVADPQAESGWKPPYMSYVTLVNFIDEKLGANPLPPRIDRAFLDTYAGSVQFMLLGTLRTMGLIGEGGEVRAELHQAVDNPEGRKAVFRAWGLKFYAEQIALAERNATGQMLWESFTKHGLTGSTMRKAVVFYLSLSDDVGLPKSPHFKPPRQVVRSGSKPRKVQSPPPTPRDEAPAPPPASRIGQGEQKTISLGAAGSVTIAVDVRWLDLPDETFAALRQAIRDLEALSVPESSFSVVAAQPDEVRDE